MTITLSYVVPTVGRVSLGEVLADLYVELSPADEVIVVGDGLQPAAASVAARFAPVVRYVEHARTHCWGNAQRNHGIGLARGTHVAFLDDDDRLAVGAVARIRAALAEAPDRPHLFRIHYGSTIIWKIRSLTLGNVGTQTVVVPNIPDRLGRYGERYAGDFDFIESTVRRYPGGVRDVVWRDEIVAVHGAAGTLAACPPDCIRGH